MTEFDWKTHEVTITVRLKNRSLKSAIRSYDRALDRQIAETMRTPLFKSEEVTMAKAMNGEHMMSKKDMMMPESGTMGARSATMKPKRQLRKKRAMRSKR